MYQYILKPKAKVVHKKKKLWDDEKKARSGKVKDCKTAIAVRQM